MKIERRTWIVREGEATIELVLHRGEAVADDCQAPIREIELELKDGDPATRFAFARRIDAVAPIRLGVQTKAERGYLMTGPTATVFKVEPLALASELTATQAFIVQSCLRQLRLHEGVLLSDRNATALHQARVSLRRLRSAFSIFKPVIGGDGRAKLREELHWLSSKLAMPEISMCCSHAPNPTLLERVAPMLQPRLQQPAAILRIIVILLFALASLRQMFSGSILVGTDLVPSENILWSVGAIALAIGYLIWGIRSGQRAWRIGSLALMLVAVAKVFLLDAAGLEGLLRIASFLALGFSLIGIGWLYSRYLKADTA